MNSKIHISDRIKELMDAKNYNQSELERRSGVERTTLRRIINKKRIIESDELVAIAKALHITPERLRQRDTKEIEEEICALLERGDQPKRAVMLSSSFLNVAIGCTEEAVANAYMGRALVGVEDYKSAQKYFEKSFECAKATEDLERIQKATFSLLTYYFESKKYDLLIELTEEIEESKIFADNYETLGKLMQFRGLSNLLQKEHKEAKKYYLKSYEYYLKTENPILIGRIQLNLANRECREGNYAQSKLYFKESLINLQNDTIQIKIEWYKDYAKMLIIDGKHDEARKAIDDAFTAMESSELELNELRSKFQLLLFDLTKDVHYLHCVLEKTKNSKQLKYCAAYHATKHYVKVGDAEKVLTLIAIIDKNVTEENSDYKRSDWF